MLLTGLDLLCNLLGVFNQFRERKHPITADFEGMYIQVSVNTEYRKFLRFLWGAEEPVIFLVHFDSSCEPNLLLLVQFTDSELAPTTKLKIIPKSINLSTRTSTWTTSLQPPKTSTPQ